MANRRMFSLDVVDTDRFLDMSASAQALYFHLGMRADDDGFVSSPRKIATVIDAGYIGMYNRYDKVPKEVWSAHVYTIGAEAEDVLSVMIEDEK